MNKGQLEKNISLKECTSFRIGGPADYFYEALGAEELIQAQKLACRLKIPLFLLGVGSNLLISDRGFRGLVVKNSYREIKKLKNNCLKVSSGILTAEALNFCQENGLSGLEFLTGIPGTIGGAICNNAGTPQEPFYGGCIADVFKKASLLTAQGKITTVNRSFLSFEYRTSKIKKTSLEKRPIILKSIFQLQESDPADIKKVIEIKLKKRSAAEPKGFGAGCIFKNPKDNYAGMLIDKANLKGKRIGGAMVSDLHANYIINDQNATASDVFKLIELIQKEVKNKFEIDLELEIELVGF
ncbi:MAG: UDP-N-acetylmuramate dehydrogenase [Candidatus Shapirobacteria bacterium]